MRGLALRLARTLRRVYWRHVEPSERDTWTIRTRSGNAVRYVHMHQGWMAFFSPTDVELQHRYCALTDEQCDQVVLWSRTCPGTLDDLVDHFTSSR